MPVILLDTLVMVESPKDCFVPRNRLILIPAKFRDVRHRCLQKPVQQSTIEEPCDIGEHRLLRVRQWGIDSQNHVHIGDHEFKWFWLCFDGFKFEKIAVVIILTVSVF